MTPTKMAKKYQACCGRPAGAGMSAMMMATATGAMAVQEMRFVGESHVVLLRG
jgi:hypothetical protein